MPPDALNPTSPLRMQANSDESFGWRRDRGDAALIDVHRSIAVTGGSWRRMAAFLGPGYMVAVGYMDPGNWATDLAGGAR